MRREKDDCAPRNVGNRYSFYNEATTQLALIQRLRVSKDLTLGSLVRGPRLGLLWRPRGLVPLNALWAFNL